MTSWKRVSETARVVALVAVVALCALALLIAGLWGIASIQREKLDRKRLADCRAVAAWLNTQELAVGAHAKLTLPAQLSGVAARGYVDVVKFGDGRLVILIKEYIGFHENYEGVLYSTVPFTSGDFRRNSYGRDEFFMDYPIAAPMLDRKINPQLYEVSFYLG